MPTINLGDDNQKTLPQTPPVQDDWVDPWSGSFGPSTPPSESKSKRMTPQERVGMIETLYTEILGRKPDTRDINYYKYSTLTEEEIRKQLIAGNEHKQLLLDGRDYKKMKERALQSETRVRVLEGQIRDQVEEFKQLTTLLKEKNRYIQEIREKLNERFDTHPFKQIDEQTFTSESSQPNSTHFVESAKPEVEKSESLLDKIRKAIEALS